MFTQGWGRGESKEPYSDLHGNLSFLGATWPTLMFLGTRDLSTMT